MPLRRTHPREHGADRRYIQQARMDEIYDREIVDVFTLQDEISALIAAALVGDFTRVEGGRASVRHE